MSEVTDKELVNIVHVCTVDYQHEAVEAAENELERRELSILQIEELKREVFEDKYQKNQQERNAISNILENINFHIFRSAKLSFRYAFYCRWV